MSKNIKLLVLHNSPKDVVISGEHMAAMESNVMLDKAGYIIDTIDFSGSLVNASKAQTLLNNKIAEFEPDVLIVHRWFPHGSFINELSVPTLLIVHAYLPICIAGTLVQGTQRCYKCVSGSAIHGVLNRCYQGSLWQSAVAGLLNGHQRNNGIIRKADMVAFPSRRTQKVFLEKIPDISQQTTVLPLAVKVPDQPVKPMSERSGFVFVGQIESYKGIDALVDAWPDDVELTIIGSGSLQDRIAQQVNQTPNISFVGRKSRDEVYEAVGRSKALIFPSKMPETFGRVFAEACATGTWTIALADTTVADEISRLGVGSIGHSIAELPELAAGLSDYDPNLVRKVYDSNYSEQIWTQSISTLIDALLDGD